MSYCKLYIDSDKSQKQIQSFINEILDKLESSHTSYIQTINIVVFNNDNHNSAIEIGEKLDPTETVYYVDIYDENDNSDKPEFRKITIELLCELRKEFKYGVASCNFEQSIFEKTGWNWTENQPYPN